MVRICSLVSVGVAALCCCSWGAAVAQEASDLGLDPMQVGGEANGQNFGMAPQPQYPQEGSSVPEETRGLETGANPVDTMQSMGNQPTTPAGSETHFARRSRDGNSQVDREPTGTNKNVSMLKRKNFALWQVLAVSGAAVVGAALISTAISWLLHPSKKSPVAPIQFSLPAVSPEDAGKFGAPKDYAPWTKRTIQYAKETYDFAPVCTGKECCGEKGADLIAAVEKKGTDELKAAFLQEIALLLPEAHVAGTAADKRADHVVAYCQKWLALGYKEAAIRQIALLDFFRHTTKLANTDALLISQEDFEQHIGMFVTLLVVFKIDATRVHYLEFVRQVNEHLEKAKTGKAAPAEAAKTPKETSKEEEKPETQKAEEKTAPNAEETETGENPAQQA
eukprot:GHVT01066030.1.p1 GENE.GHVT01066030.1~~GHVT01066030.1.p1  ORF type:complete len:393 (+),score=87.08 GHVT01066030.1:340-1518(+)